LFEKYRLIIELQIDRWYTPESIQLKELFEIRKDYGYQFLSYFSDKKEKIRKSREIYRILKTFSIAKRR
jgi:putative colanic acid biosynthesis UDP-glucose lipid carrier transferase